MKFLQILEMITESNMKTMTREKVKQIIRDGSAEMNSGDLATVQNGQHIELRLIPSKKIKIVRIEG